MDKIVYALGSVLTLFCSIMLFKGYWRSKSRLLLWSALFFVIFTLSNVLLYVDLIILPVETDLSLLRISLTLVGVLVLLFGLIWETT